MEMEQDKNGKLKGGNTLDRTINVLSDWEWMTLVGAMRYYEYRSSIASATFPNNVVALYWGSGRYGKSVQIQLANQFAIVDHGIKGEGDWAQQPAADRLPWCRFHAFCKGVCNGFLKYRAVYGGKVVTGDCFRCETNGRLYPVEQYISNPWICAYLVEDALMKED